MDKVHTVRHDILPVETEENLKKPQSRQPVSQADPSCPQHEALNQTIQSTSDLSNIQCPLKSETTTLQFPATMGMTQHFSCFSCGCKVTSHRLFHEEGIVPPAYIQ